jgi:hypothetical protein
MNDLVRFPYETISKSFYSALQLGLFIYIPPLPSDTNKKQRTERLREIGNLPRYITSFSRSIGQIKKTNCTKMFLRFSSIGI